MRIALTLCTLLASALGIGCPAASDSGTTPTGSSPPPSAPAPEPTPAPEPAPAPAPGDGGSRAAAVPSGHAQYARVEGTSFQNGCSADPQCFVGGCSSEVCSAEEGVSSTCEAPAAGWPSKGATCGCVQGQCIWYKSGGGEGGGTHGGGTNGGGTKGGGTHGGGTNGAEPSAGAPSTGGPAQGQTCSSDGKCAKGLTCVKYYGIAGPRGPEMTSCEIPCSGPKNCPKGQHCLTISDGPGQVCRPD